MKALGGVFRNNLGHETGALMNRTVVVQSLSHVWLFVTSRITVFQASLSFTISQSSLRSVSIESMILSNHFILYHFFHFCLQSFLSSGSFPMSLPFTSGGQTILASDSASNTYSWFISFRNDYFDLFVAYSSTTIQKCQFFSVQLCLWSSSHIYTWLLEKL